MKAKRKRHSPALKAKVGLEALMGIKTIAQIARENAVHPMQVSQWKTVVRERLPDLFESDRKEAQNQEELIAALHQKVGELTVDLDYLKKKSKQLGL
jgi:transposase